MTWVPEEDETLVCPGELESATGHYDPAGPDGGTCTRGLPVCAGCGAGRDEHVAMPW